MLELPGKPGVCFYVFGGCRVLRARPTAVPADWRKGGLSARQPDRGDRRGPVSSPEVHRRWGKHKQGGGCEASFPAVQEGAGVSLGTFLFCSTKESIQRPSH